MQFYTIVGVLPLSLGVFSILAPERAKFTTILGKSAPKGVF